MTGTGSRAGGRGAAHAILLLSILGSLFLNACGPEPDTETLSPEAVASTVPTQLPQASTTSVTGSLE